MDLTTELLDTAAFREAKRGGYNTQDVDEFIEQVKAEYKQHAAMLSEAQKGLAPLKARLAQAERQASKATERAGATTDSDDLLGRTLVLAQRTADAAIKEAEAQASATLSSAQDQAARMLADAQEATARARTGAESEARRAQEEARTRVLGELRDLEAARDQLYADVDTLERHLEEQRDRVRLSTRELQRLLDDPAALREVTVPAVSDVTVARAASPADPGPLRSSTEEDTEDTEDTTAWVPDDEVWPEPEPEAGGTPLPLASSKARDADAAGPPAEVVGVPAARDGGDDAYLAELRKAMTDESPLGPREEGDVDPLFDPGSEPGRSRFGRRR